MTVGVVLASGVVATDGGATAAAQAVVAAGLAVTEGANAAQGVATLVAGTVTVNNTRVTANSRIFLTAQNLGTVVTPSALCVSARVNGVSFTILASQGGDTSIVAWEIFTPAP